MREIIFRGNRIENNEWVYGDLIQLGQSADYWYIMPIGVSGEMYEDEPYPFRENDVMCRCALSKVNPSTVGQYTGLKDKNGNLIFEGDIVKINGWWNAAGPAGYNENQTVVKFNDEFCGFNPMCDYDCDCGVYHPADECEVIGNMHDNPELLHA